jgi:hypothetical protein
LAEVSPEVVALEEEASLPVSERGPVERWAFERLASICAAEVAMVVGCPFFSFFDSLLRFGGPCGDGLRLYFQSAPLSRVGAKAL